MGVPDDRMMEPWVLVAGGFHRHGGMDRLNSALARYLIERGNPVHLVCHSVEPELREGAASVHVVPKPGGSFMLGGMLLAREGRLVASRVNRQSSTGTRVVVNGGNCDWPDINWVHCVHHAWKRNDYASPYWFRLKNRCSLWLACRREWTSLRRARVAIANSERTRRDLIEHLGMEPERIHVVYPGADPQFTPSNAGQRAASRAWLGKGEQPLVAFVGALGYDSNKGFDVLLPAWRRLCARRNWDADLIVAGGGRGLGSWTRHVAEAGLESRITLLGFTDRVADVLAAADLLVSPARYESYGLNVHEAICCGVPAMVTETAGVAERYPAELWELLINNPEDIEALAERIFRWRAGIGPWKQRIASFSQALRSYTLDAMAKRIVRITNSQPSEQAA
jgi:glycosyltransferase involved in cell wall biosynthesis